MKTMLEMLRDLREDKDMSQREVADILGVSQQQYSQYESGANDVPLKHFAKLIELFDVSADYLLGRTTLPPHKSFKNTYVTRDCSCVQLVEDVLALTDDSRKSVVEYVELQRIKERMKKR